MMFRLIIVKLQAMIFALHNIRKIPLVLLKILKKWEIWVIMWETECGRIDSYALVCKNRVRANKWQIEIKSIGMGATGMGAIGMVLFLNWLMSISYCLWVKFYNKLLHSEHSLVYDFCSSSFNYLCCTWHEEYTWPLPPKKPS